MTISELIANLEQQKLLHGDIEVYYVDSYGGGYDNVDRVEPSYPWKYENGVCQVGEEDLEQPPFGIVLA